MSDHKPPEILDKIVDLVLAYRPKTKSKGSKKRKKNAKKIATNSTLDSYAPPAHRERK